MRMIADNDNERDDGDKTVQHPASDDTDARGQHGSSHPKALVTVSLFQPPEDSGMEGTVYARVSTKERLLLLLWLALTCRESAFLHRA